MSRVNADLLTIRYEGWEQFQDRSSCYINLLDVNGNVVRVDLTDEDGDFHLPQPNISLERLEMEIDVRGQAVGPAYPHWKWSDGQHRQTATFVRDLAFLDADNRTLYGFGLFRDIQRLTANKAGKKSRTIPADLSSTESLIDRLLSCGKRADVSHPVMKRRASAN